MKRAELFQLIFGRYITEIWSMPEKEFLDWINKKPKTEISNDLEEIYNAIWDVDIPSPTVPEYREHHEQMVELMKLVKGKIEKYEVKND